MDEEQKKRIENLVSIFLKVKTEKESELEKKNENLLNVKWRSLMREMKIIDLKEEYFLLRQAFEQNLQIRIERTECLEKEIGQCIIQQNISAQRHIKNLEKLFSQHIQFVKEERQKFDDLLKSLCESTTNRERRLELAQYVNMERLEDIIFVLNKENSLREQNLSQKLRITCKTITNKNKKDRKVYSSNVEENIETFWQPLHHMLVIYSDELAKQHKSFLQFKQQEETLKRKYDMYSKKLSCVKEMNEKVNAALVEERRAHQKRTDCLKADLQRLKTLTSQVKNDYDLKRKQNAGIISDLVVASHEVYEELNKRYEQSQKLIGLYRNCQNLEETSGFNICSTEFTAVTSSESSQTTAIVTMSGNESTKPAVISSVVSTCDRLIRFWDRFSVARLHLSAIEAEQHSVQLENQQLRQTMQQYLANASSRANGAQSMVGRSEDTIKVVPIVVQRCPDQV